MALRQNFTRVLAAGAIGLLSAGAAHAGPRPTTQPSSLTFPIYTLNFAAPPRMKPFTPPPAAREDTGVNLGGVNIEVEFTYLTDYVYRGIDHSEFSRIDHAPDLQFDGNLDFNPGRFPHPVVGVFVNEFNDDPISASRRSGRLRRV